LVPARRSTSSWIKPVSAIRSGWVAGTAQIGADRWQGVAMAHRRSADSFFTSAARAADNKILFRELRWAAAAMQLEDGPRAGGASGRGGDRATGSTLDRRAVAHSG
jgi:hypothetical protein